MALQFIDKADLKEGMYVHLNLSWFEHPFASAKFKITDAGMLAKVKALRKLRNAEWDPERSDVRETMAEDVVELSREDIDAMEAAEVAKVAARNQLKASRSRLNLAEKKVSELSQRVRDLMPNLISANEVALSAASTIANEVTEELTRDPNAVMQLINVPTGNDYFFSGHAINVTALSVMLARATDMDNEWVRDIGVGAFLHDLGIMRLPKQLSLKPNELSGPEQALYHEHVRKGAQMVEGTENASLIAINIIRYHHERCDGTGYPYQLVAADIPVEAKVVAIANRYDNLCNPRNGGTPLSPSAAVKQMFGKERAWFAPNLLDRFIRALGVYPPGSLVALSDDRTALVVEANPNAPLRPSVVVYDPTVERTQAVPIDLNEHHELTIARSFLLDELPKAITGYLVLSSQTSYFLTASVEEEILQAGMIVSQGFGQTKAAAKTALID